MLSQKERVNESGAQLAALSQQLATLQVENSTLASQLSSMTAQSAGLQTSLTGSEAEKEKLTGRLQASEARLERVSRDQQDLQKLHEQLQRDYDSLLAEREQLKASQRESKSELRSLQEQLATGLQAEKEWQEKRTELTEELEKARTENRSLGNLRAEHSRLKDDFRSLFVANEKLKNEYKSLQGDYKGLRGDHNSLKLKHTQLQGEAQESRHQVTNLDVELGKLTNKLSVLQQWNTTLEEDKRNLVNQVSVLLAQYHELLSQTLEEKDHFHEETKNFADKLNHLKRQKEILEDKIMEQYRRMENSPLSGGGSGSHNRKSGAGLGGGKSGGSGIGALFVRKMRRASSELISRVPRSRSRNRVGDSLSSPELQDVLQADNYSLESGSQHSGGSNSGSGSLDGGEGGNGGGNGSGTEVSTPRSVSGQGNLSGGMNNLRHSVPNMTSNNLSAIGLGQDRTLTNNSPIRNSLSSVEGGQSSNRSSPTNNGNTTNTISTTATNGNDPEMLNTATSTTTTTGNGMAALHHHHQMLNSSLHMNSAAPYMMMSPLSSTPIKPVQPLPRISNGLNNGNGGSNGNSSPCPVPLQRFNQSSRSLALLERAGSRTPVCISEVLEPILSTDDPTSDNLPVAAYSSPLVTPRNGNSPTNSTTSAATTTIGSGVNTEPVGPNNKLFPHLTSTTRINVNISTANVTPLLERRGSFRGSGIVPPPRPSPRIGAGEDTSPPLLPARSSTLQERPALPPRPSTLAVGDESAARSAAENGNDSTTVPPASSIWYEYGCV